jgi:hypothetical protein
MDETLIQEQDNGSYMKGNSRHWFWALVAVVLLTFAITLVGNLQGDSGILSNLPVIVPALISSFFMLCWAALYYIYGTQNNVKLAKIFFVLLACLQLLVSILFVTSSILSQLTLQYGYVHSLLGTISSSANIIIRLVWIAFLVLVAINGKTNSVLRASAILLLLINVALFVFGFISSRLIQNENYDLYNMISTVTVFAQVAAMIFFFAAMSFTKRRVPKDGTPASMQPAE